MNMAIRHCAHIHFISLKSCFRLIDINYKQSVFIISFLIIYSTLFITFYTKLVDLFNNTKKMLQILDL